MPNALYTREQAYRDALAANSPSVDQATNSLFGMQPGMDRLAFLPRHDPQYGWVMPNALYNAARAFVSSGTAMRGGQVSPEDALNTAGYAMTGGLGASRALPPQGPGKTVGMGAKDSQFVRPMVEADRGAEIRLSRVQNISDEYRLPNLRQAVPEEYLPTATKTGAQTVTVYRAAPKGAEGIRPGDWVTLDRGYAKMHGGGKIISMKVPSDHVAWAGTDMNEFFYVPRGSK